VISAVARAAAAAILAVLATGKLSAADGDGATVQAAARGAAVFQRYCVLCHGLTGHGNGRAARLHSPRPVDLTQSEVNDQYRELIIRRGGQQVGRSAAMPPWQDELTAQQIRDVVAFLRSLSAARQR